MKYHKRLIHVVIVFAFLSLGNAIDFYFGTKNDFRLIQGKVTNVEISSYFGKTRYTRRTYYTKTTIKINDGRKKYFTIEQSAVDSLLVKLKTGDIVGIYARRWYQRLPYFGLNANMFLVVKDGTVIYDVMYRCKKQNMIFMIVFGIIALFVFVIYLDVVKDISLENWFQKRILKNPDYLNK
jgi:hypothetical protein